MQHRLLNHSPHLLFPFHRLLHVSPSHSSIAATHSLHLDSSAVPANVRNTVYCTGIAEGGEEAWNFAWEQYLTTNVANQKDMLLSALGCAKEVWLLSR